MGNIILVTFEIQKYTEDYIACVFKFKHNIIRSKYCLKYLV